MALTPIPNGLDLSTLEPILLQAKLQSTNPALYQTILAMLRNMQAIVKLLNANIEDTANSIPTGTGITELTGDVTAGPGSGAQAATIPADTVQYAQIQNVSAISKLLGRGSASGAGNVEEITLGTNLAMSGTTLNATDTDTGITQLTGDVTAGPGSGSQGATIPNDTVTYAKIQNISAASKLLGRGSASGSGDTEEITLGTNLAMAGTTLNASGGGGGTPAGSTGDVQFNTSGAFDANANFNWDDSIHKLVLTSASGIGLKIIQTSTFNAGINLVRSGGTASDWLIYLKPSTDSLVFFSGADRATLTSAGVLALSSLQASGVVEIGASVASAGSVRLANNSAGVQARNALNSGDVGAITVDASDQVIVGFGSSGSILFKPSNTEQAAIVSGAGIRSIAAGAFYWDGRAVLVSPANAQITMTNFAATSGFGLQCSTADTMIVANKAQNAYGTVDCLGLKASGVAGANNTFASPSSITVVNGIVTSVTAGSGGGSSDEFGFFMGS